MKVNLILVVAIYFISFSFSKGQAPFSFYLNHGLYQSCRFTSDAIYILNTGNSLDKLDYEGNIIWSKMLPAYTRQLEVRGNSIYIVSDWNLIKLDTAANLIWGRNLSSQSCVSSTYVRNMMTDVNHIYVIMGNNTWERGSLIVFDTVGTIVNSWCDFPGFSSCILQGFERMTGGAWFRFFSSGTGTSYAFISRADNLGNIDNSVHSVFLHAGADNDILDIIPLPDSTYIALNSTFTLNFGGAGQFALTRIRDDGTVIWDKRFHFNDTSILDVQSAGVDSLGNIYVVGGKINYSTNSSIFSVKLDSSGTIINSFEWINLPSSFWMQNYVRMGHHNGMNYFPFTINGGSNSGVLAMDSLLTPPCGVQQFQNLISEDSSYDDTLTWTNYPPVACLQVDTIPVINNSSIPVISDLCLVLSTGKIENRNQIDLFPNPSGNTILVNSPNKASISVIEIYDIEGKSIVHTSVAQFPAEINIQSLTRGIYFVKLQNENGSYVQKLVVE